MRKLHVLMKKEELQEEKLKDKIVVVFDILMATTTIATVLENGAKEVIPVKDSEEAYEVAKNFDHQDYCLAGEYLGRTINGFLDPYPQALKRHVKDKSVILSTTNGTVAIRHAQKAKETYAASMLNSMAIANHIFSTNLNKTVLLVCSGSHGSFNLEDFYGAGYFIECLFQCSNQWTLTDSATAAHLFYEGNKDNGEKIMLTSRVGKKIHSAGYGDELKFASQKSVYDQIVKFTNGKCTVLNKMNEELKK
ncbi:putative 2-phosphosulfolactate phosphatase [Robertmurraya siralis]|uniref:Probable 2-phosphosulfolactate phosphatase n=1 Tax=Robertmurraya siralis TaxID=77777 RepID=A0A919WIG7_9BACI|nr:2-phosphosulfolactate phosphatase [Robertmurraya siralis]GIN62560.1 putative 2-phosphosulfolactate phosphatase [Robertmurraya siralis]